MQKEGNMTLMLRIVPSFWKAVYAKLVLQQGVSYNTFRDRHQLGPINSEPTQQWGECCQNTTKWRIWTHSKLTGNSHQNSWKAHLEDTQLPHSELSRWLTLWACRELSVSLQLRQWAHCYHCMVSSSGDLTNKSKQAHLVSCKLIESSRQAHSVSHLLSSL